MPKHQIRGLSVGRLVISLYARDMSVCDIEDELRDIYGITLSSLAISIITNKVTQAAAEWQDRPLERLYMVVSMDGIVFKVMEPGKVINNTVYLCVGLKPAGYMEVWCMWLGKTEFWSLWLALQEIGKR